MKKAAFIPEDDDAEAIGDGDTEVRT